jgi:hypothetical protein
LWKSVEYINLPCTSSSPDTAATCTEFIIF